MIRTFAEAEERLAETLPGYESRVPQQKLAAAVTAAIESQRHLLGQAGCGVGKSLAYLVTGIASGKRVVVSTATKALQTQLAEKDLPFLTAHLGHPFTWSVLKGRKNYLCLNNALCANPADVPHLTEIIEASKQDGFTGERESLPFEVPGTEWNLICGDSDECSANKCKDHAAACWAEQARQRARDSQVVIVNHALLMTDLKVKELTGGAANMLDNYQVVVFDEAHEVRSYATDALGTTFREAGIRGLVSEASNFGHRDVPDQAKRIDDACAAVSFALTDLWAVLEVGRIREDDLLAHADQYVNLTNALSELSDIFVDRTLTDGVEWASVDGAKKRQQRVSRRAANAARRFEEVLMESFDDLVRFVEEETTPGGRKQKVLRTAPINVAPYLREHLFSDDEVTAILVSATLAVGEDFSYIAKCLGVDEYDGLDVGSPFDFARQGRIYVPTDLPAPAGDTRAAWSSLMSHRAKQVIEAAGGGALFLFTSTKEMKSAYAAIAPMLPYTCLMQGEASNKVLAQQFKEDVDSVLFATRSFMTGVDFQGRTCRLVMIDKLPFPVPTEPITEARIEAIKRAGGNDFADFTIPEMVLVLLQAVGRLIRSLTDYGVVAVFDPRLATKGYGKKIRRSLPPFTSVDSIAEVAEFFAGQEAA
jgi:ATP-dependent DNA helicase DinG